MPPAAANAGPPLFCTRVRIAPDGEILVARTDRRARAAIARTAGSTPATSASLDERGRLQVTGRKADTIVSGGENVAPAEVEAALEAHPDVLEAGGARARRRELGGGRHGDRRRAAGRGRDRRGAARALRAHAGAVQDAQAGYPRQRAPAPHRLGQAAAQGARQPLRTSKGDDERRGAQENELQDETDAASDFDPQAHRVESLAGWQAAAPGWVRQQALISSFGAPVSGWMLDALAPQRAASACSSSPPGSARRACSRPS